MKVIGIREILEREIPDDDLEPPSQENDLMQQSFDIVMFGAHCCAVNPVIVQPPSATVVQALLDIYITRVDPIFKVAHAPSLRTFLLAEKPNSSDMMGSHVSEALKFAIYFISVCTLDEFECQDKLHEGKNEMVNR